MTVKVQQKEKNEKNKNLFIFTADSWLLLFLKNNNIPKFSFNHEKNSLLQYIISEKKLLLLLDKIIKVFSEKDINKRKEILPNDSPGFTSSYSTEYETQLRIFYNNVRKTLTKEKNSEYLITLIKN